MKAPEVVKRGGPARQNRGTQFADGPAVRRDQIL